MSVYVGTLKGVGRIYQQTFIDAYAKVAFAKPYDRKSPMTAATRNLDARLLLPPVKLVRRGEICQDDRPGSRLPEPRTYESLPAAT
jgi:hypothetical protein